MKSWSQGEGQRDTRTVAETLFYLEDPKRRLELEQFRIDYEKKHGPTDLTKRYTCTWPAEGQEILREQDPKAYFEGFPDFVKAYIKRFAEKRKEIGVLDETPDDLLELLIRGQVSKENCGGHRGI